MSASTVTREDVRVPVKSLDKYQITRTDYLNQFEAQGFCCAICSKPYATGHRATDWAIDHCHKSGALRGILCAKCNTGIGMLGEDPWVFYMAAKYCHSAKKTTRLERRGAKERPLSDAENNSRMRMARAMARSFVNGPVGLKDMGEWTEKQWKLAIAGSWADDTSEHRLDDVQDMRQAGKR